MAAGSIILEGSDPARSQNPELNNIIIKYSDH